MDQLIMACLTTVQEFLRKSSETPLSEDEALLYQQAARTARAYLKSIENSFRMGLIDQERELDRRLEEQEGGDGQVASGPTG